MTSTLNRPAVDLAADRPRPGLALVLALLSVPGSTIAWELPAGGLWIGMPLAIAAIVLGIRARRRRVGTAMATVAAAIAGDVQGAVDESGVQEGMVLVSAMHITAAVWVNDDEPGILEDALEWLDKLAPPSWRPQENPVAAALAPEPGARRSR